MSYQQTLKFTSSGHGSMRDLTNEVANAVRASKVNVGLANVFAVGSTAAIVAIEFEPGLRRDLPELLDRLMPPSRDYGHEQAWHDGNGHSHLQATTLGPSLTVPICDGQLMLGTWQQIAHVECDIHRRDRQVIVTVTGDY